ncbi:hypothetical protein BKA56DRAFT_673563 [Ilyonectria sp. MPI-CAGE-AT-0026]|nr:hypothetical protein BKA56DRAFT_673563 [Ilyonectria sp. MPI-CAGE-AT-0026]
MATPSNMEFFQRNLFEPARVGPLGLQSLPYFPKQLATRSMPTLLSDTSMDMATAKRDSHRRTEEDIKPRTPPSLAPDNSPRNVSLEVERSFRHLSQTSSRRFLKILPKSTSHPIFKRESPFKLCFTDTDPKPHYTTPNNDTTNKMTSWYCSRDGILDLFQDLNLTNVETSIDKSDVSLFRLVNDQAPNLPRHILKWGEAKNNDIVIWSIQEARSSNTDRKIHITVPTSRRRGIRGEVCKLMADLDRGKGRGRELAKSFKVIKVKEEAREAVWHLVRRPEAKSPTITRKRVEAWVASVAT